MSNWGCRSQAPLGTLTTVLQSTSSQDSPVAPVTLGFRPADKQCGGPSRASYAAVVSEAAEAAAAALQNVTESFETAVSAANSAAAAGTLGCSSAHVTVTWEGAGGG